jgi:outer membrane protein OmpA-like peptidoglycan-associated protein
LKSILHIPSRAFLQRVEPLRLARAGVVVALAAALSACGGGTSWRSSSAMGPDGKSKVSRSSAPASGATEVAAAANAPGAKGSLKSDQPTVKGSDGSAAAAGAAASDSTSAAARSDEAARAPEQPESANVQQYKEPEPTAANDADSGHDAAAEAGNGSAGGDAEGSDAMRAGENGERAGAASAGDSSAGGGGQSDSSGGDAVAGANGSDSASGGGTAAAAGGAAQEGSSASAGDSGATAGTDSSRSASGADSGAGGDAAGSAGASDSGASGNQAAGADTSMTNGANGAEVAAVSPGDQNAGSGLESGSATGATGELPGAAGDINDATAGTGQSPAASDGQMVAGVVEAPGQKASSHEVVMPQTLGGMLPMTIGVDGEGEFDFDKAVLRDDVKSLLDQLANRLKEAEFDQLEIVGHADRIGTEDYNQYLSERRAWAVARYLVKQGVPVSKIKVVGKGMYQPLTNNNECVGLDRTQLIACLQKDRRVEISASIRRADVEVR